MCHNLLNHLTKFGIQANGIIPMDPSDEIRTFPQINLILLTPLDPLMVLVADLHCCTFSIACRMCFS